MDMDDFNAQLSQALVDYMAEHGVTQTAVAEAIGRSQGYVWGRLSGTYNLSVDIIGAVASLSHISPRALMVELTERMAR